MYRGVTIFFNQSFGNKDGVLEVITIPGHECDQHILAQCQFTHVCRRSVGQHIMFGDNISRFYQWPLVDTGILVGTGIFNEVIDINTGLTGIDFFLVYAHYNAAGIH